MYTEEYEAKSFPLRNFLLKLILVLIFVFLLIWLVPKFTAPKVLNTNKDNSSITDKRLSALENQIFADNIKKMQDAATSYYTTERLPKEINAEVSMTLKEMINKKLLVPLVDKNNKSCNVDKSYVKVTKLENEYLMKVNLKCSDKEDYILVHMGCYDYCKDYICATKDTVVTIKKSTPSREVVFGGGSNNNGGTTPSDPTKPEEPTVKPPQPVAGFEYEYKKTTGAKFSDWSNWSSWDKTNCDTKAYACNDNDPKCLKKTQTYSRKENIGTYDKEYVKARNEVRQTSSYQQLSCANYEYIKVDNTTYVTTTNTYNTINYVNSTTQSNVSGWRYNGRANYDNPPRDTITTRYKFVGANFGGCGTTCQTLPKYIYDSYTYVGAAGAVNSTSSSQTTSSTSSSTSSTIKVNCVGQATKTIPVYSTITVYEKATRREPLYGTACYVSNKTRKVTNPGKTDTKWSDYNNKALLNDGYYYTGNSRRKG